MISLPEGDVGSRRMLFVCRTTLREVSILVRLRIFIDLYSGPDFHKDNGFVCRGAYREKYKVSSF